jgi:superfamily II RNA helicase
MVNRLVPDRNMRDGVPWRRPGSADAVRAVKGARVPHSTATPLVDRIPEGGTTDTNAILDIFLGWTADIGFTLYDHQEEALLEIMAGRHVILGTPTGSGKSLVALGLHFKGLCEGRRSFYTSPIKALASEKFFSLCDDLGPENVGMLTGDAAINPDATVICCTAEVLANMALRQGELLDAPYVIMDEFHYYADRDRGWAWQVPLLTLPFARFLLMSATLGDMSGIGRHIEERTGGEVAMVTSVQRPVPLEFSYRETPLHETVFDLMKADQAPIYIVNFTQRECAELAQNLTSMPLTTKAEKKAIREAMAGARFDSPYGKELRRFLSFGIGVHHAGLLPKYRLLVEQLAQQGHLKVVSGTDTLGVGVNIPIRTVLFTALAKYDGRKVALLKVRDFQQIAGRAGRRGFDDQGWVVCQAPEEVIKKKTRDRKSAGKPARKKRPAPRRREGEVSWNPDTFTRLIESQPERLNSRFRLTNGMVLDLIQRDADEDDPSSRNFRAIRDIIDRCHEDPESKRRLQRRAAEIVRSLYRLGIVHLTRDVSSNYLWVTTDEDLQVDFSLFHNLSLFLVETIDGLDSESDSYAIDLLSCVEAVLEDPVVVLRRQVDVVKTQLINQLKADRVPYEERMNRLDEITHPQPLDEYLFIAFGRFQDAHPWVGGDLVKPKSVAREMLEEFMNFGEYVRQYGLQRSEGVLLRYLSQVYKTLDQNVPDQAKTDAVWDVIGWLRSVIERVDTSLIEEWEGLMHPELRFQGADKREIHRASMIEQLLADHRALHSRIRAEMHLFLRALAREEWDEAAAGVSAPEGGAAWSPDDLANTMMNFFASFSGLRVDHEARLADKTVITDEGDRRFSVVQRILAVEGDDSWYARATVDLSRPDALDSPLLRLEHLGNE